MKLHDYLQTKSIKRSEFAALIGKSQSYVTMLCQGAIWPSRDAAQRIAEATGGLVTANDFVASESTTSPSPEAA